MKSGAFALDILFDSPARPRTLSAWPGEVISVGKHAAAAGEGSAAGGDISDDDVACKKRSLATNFCWPWRRRGGDGGGEGGGTCEECGQRRSLAELLASSQTDLQVVCRRACCAGYLLQHLCERCSFATTMVVPFSPQWNATGAFARRIF